LLNHDAQLLKLEKTIVPIRESTFCYVGNINGCTIYEFKCKLSMESWEDVFKESDTNVTFNKFLNIYFKSLMFALLKAYIIPSTDITHV